MTSFFHFLRHASHGHLGRVLTGREEGAQLTEAGQTEAQAAAETVAGLGTQAVYSSPRLRAIETAEILARRTGVEVAIAPELDEIDFGRWTGKSFSELESDPHWQRWNAERDTAATPAGETMDAIAGQVISLMKDLDDGRGGSFVLVSHADVIKAVVCRCLDLPFSSVHKFEVQPASLTTISLDDNGSRLISLNVCSRKRTRATLVGAAA